ncbi:MAG: ABC-2 type transport system ATP-binding protein [Phycisphaerales bacterium]|jgi:ABC-2 type transport system ATP-binding protein
MSDLALDLSNVAKTYPGKVRALRGIDMKVGRGEVFGLLGPNGAGKSTLVKILMTVIRPTHCEGTVLGGPVGRKSTLARVGYLPEHHQFPEYMTGRQVLDFFGAMSGVDRRTRRTRAAELLQLVGMEDWAKSKVGEYSKGMRQRLGIAQSLMGDPDLVLLDEPTDGVDPVGRREIRDIVKHLRETGKTVFINSHLLSELEMVCDRVAIMVQGLIRSQGSLDELTRDQRRYEVQVSPEDEAALAAAAAGVTEEHGVAGGLLTVRSEQASVVQPVIDKLRAGGVTVLRVEGRRPSLEDLFIQAVTDPETGLEYKPGASRNHGSKKGGE